MTQPLSGQNIPPREYLTNYPSPDVATREFVTATESNLTDYLAILYGTPPPNGENPDYFLSQQVPLNWPMVKRLYAKDPVVEKTFNYNESFAEEASAYPTFTRDFLVRRSAFVAATKLLPMAGIYKATVTGGGTGYNSSTTTASVSGDGTVAVTISGGVVTGIVITATGTYTSDTSVTITDSSGAGSGASGTVFVQPQTALLVKEDLIRLGPDSERDSLWVLVRRVYMTLPGPVVTSDVYDTQRGAVQRTTQIIAATGSEVATQTETGGVVTETQYLAVEGTVLLLNKVIETYSLSGCIAFVDYKYDNPSDTFILITKTIKKTSTIVHAITLNTAPSDDLITLVESEQRDNITSFEIVTTWTQPVARDSGTQIITSQHAGPKQFPFVIYDTDVWLASNGLLGSVPKFTATDIIFTTKTFWTFSATEPALTLDGTLRPATIDSFLGFIGVSAAGDVIVDGGDDYFVGGVTVTISASTPSASTYLSSYVGGSQKSVDGQVKMDPNRYRWRTDRDFMQFIIQATPVYS